MKEGEHFGCIPGCGDKPTLFKPGAEKLCLLFRLAPAYDVEERHHERGHRSHRVLQTKGPATDFEREAMVLWAVAVERLSLAAAERTIGVVRQTVVKWLEKSPRAFRR